MFVLFFVLFACRFSVVQSSFCRVYNPRYENSFGRSIALSYVSLSTGAKLVANGSVDRFIRMDEVNDHSSQCRLFFCSSVCLFSQVLFCDTLGSVDRQS